MDVINQRLAIFGMIGLGMTAVLGCIFLQLHGQAAPEPLIALGGVCVGSLGTFCCLRTGNGGSNGYPPKA